MDINRRSFLSILGIGAFGIIAPKPIVRVFAPSGGWQMANSGIYLHKGIILTELDYRRAVLGVRPNVWRPTADISRYCPIIEIRS